MPPSCAEVRGEVDTEIRVKNEEFLKFRFIILSDAVIFFKILNSINLCPLVASTVMVHISILIRNIIVLFYRPRSKPGNLGVF